MFRTEVGYAGGTTPSPTYRSIGDHAEAVRVMFDPNTIRFEQLLELFWSRHDPFSRGLSQYRAELWCADDDQLARAQKSARVIEQESGRSVLTKISLDPTFYPAEAYHQKWRLRKDEALFSALQEHYPSEPQLLASTAAAKLNAYVSGNWDHEPAELTTVGVSLHRRSKTG